MSLTDPAASALDGIRADREAANAFGANASDPVPRLLAAVEAALNLAAGAKPVLSDAPADCSGACWMEACDCSGIKRPLAWDLDPAKVREAITAALAEHDSAPAGTVREDGGP